jgi:DNA-binding MarR family transcriptional regulator
MQATTTEEVNKNHSKDPNLDNDAEEMHKAMSELIRVYQFRDRSRICYRNISVTQCYAINSIIEKGPMTLKMLASELYLDKSTASRVIDALAKKEYIKRFTDAGDARAIRIEVTECGRKLHNLIERDLVNEMKQIMKMFEPDVRRIAAKLVAQFAKAATERFSSCKPKTCDI